MSKRYEVIKKYKAFIDNKTFPLLIRQIVNLEDAVARLLVECGILAPMPYITESRSLVIPFNAPARYRWWVDGQSPIETLAELGASDELKESHGFVFKQKFTPGCGCFSCAAYENVPTVTNVALVSDAEVVPSEGGKRWN